MIIQASLLQPAALEQVHLLMSFNGLPVKFPGDQHCTHGISFFKDCMVRRLDGKAVALYMALLAHEDSIAE